MSDSGQATAGDGCVYSSPMEAGPPASSPPRPHVPRIAAPSSGPGARPTGCLLLFSPGRRLGVEPRAGTPAFPRARRTSCRIGSTGAGAGTQAKA